MSEHLKRFFQFVLWVAFVLSAIVTIQRTFFRGSYALDDFIITITTLAWQVGWPVEQLLPGPSPTIMTISAGFLAILYSLEGREDKRL